MGKVNTFSKRALRTLTVLTITLLVSQSLNAQGWLNASWLYRRPVTVGTEATVALTYIQVKVTLDNTFDFLRANIDGSDIRITSNDGTTPLPFWIESWSRGDQQATLWVKVSSIPIGGTTIFLYYGNSSATSISSGQSTFSFFDDFESWSAPSGNSGWIDATPQPDAIADQTAAVYDGKLYLFGGYGIGPTDPRNTTWIYDPAGTGSWTSGEVMPTPRWGMVAVEFEGLIYVFGGSNGIAPGNVTANEVYDPVENSWAPLDNVPTELGHTGLMGVKFGNRIHLFYNRYHYEYNPYDDSYIRLSDVPNFRHWATCAVVGSKIYIIGGGVGEIAYEATSNNNQEYDPFTDTWTEKAPLPVSLWGMTRENPVIDGKIYVTHGVGFVTGQEIEFYSTNFVYDPATDTWEQKGPATHRRDGMACGVIEDKLYVVGGRNISGNPVGLVYNEVYDPSLDTWSPSGSDLWSVTGPQHVFVDQMAAYDGSYGLVIQQEPPGELPGNNPDLFCARSYTGFGDVYALDLRWNVTDDLGLGTVQPQGWIMVSDNEPLGALFFYRNLSGVPVVEWSYDGYLHLQDSNWDDWHDVTIVRNGSNSSVTFDGTEYSPLTSTQDVYGGAGRIKLGVYFATRAYVDNVRVRKWGGIDPSTTVGGEQSGNFQQWTGSVNGDWNNIGNWDGGSVPISTTNVVIRNTGSTPHVNISNAVCNNLAIDPSAALVIDAGMDLTVNSALSNNGTLTINSSGVSSSGSLIVDGTSTGRVSYNRVMPDGENWHYVSSPVVNPNLSPSGLLFYPWNEQAGIWGNVTTSLTSGIGYTLETNSNSVLFTGELVATDVMRPVTSPYTTDVISGTELEYSDRWNYNRSRDNYGGGGFNLLGNPYTSAIVVSSFLTANDAIFDPNYKAIYLYDGNSYWYIGSPVEGWDNNDAAVLPSQTNIQTGQGFFVLAEKDNTTFTFTKSMQAHSTASTLLKSARIRDRWPGLNLKLQYGDTQSSTLVVYHDEMTAGLDPGYDVGLMRSGSDIKIYTKLIEASSVDFARQALPLNGCVKNIIPVGIDFENGGEVTFSSDIEPLKNYKFILEDRASDIFTDLSSGNYTVVLPAKTYGTGRFFVHVSARRNAIQQKNDPDLMNIRIWSSQNNQVNIQGVVSDQARCEVFDILGRKVFETYLTDSDYNTFTVPSVTNGMFLIKLIDGAKIINQKVMFP